MTRGVGGFPGNEPVGISGSDVVPGSAVNIPKWRQAQVVVFKRDRPAGSKRRESVHEAIVGRWPVMACLGLWCHNKAMTSAPKVELRKQFFSQRKQLPYAERQRQSAQLCDVLLTWYQGLDAAQRASSKVAMTIQFGTEPDTDPLLQAFHDLGVELWVPITNADRSMFWTRWYPGVPMEQSRLAPIQEPTGQRFGPEVVADADVIFVPALAADTAGYRMGKGGGYYDRLLAALPELTEDVPLLVTPVFDHEFFAADAGAFPVEDHDLPVQAVVTAQTGLVWVQ